MSGEQSPIACVLGSIALCSWPHVFPVKHATRIAVQTSFCVTRYQISGGFRFQIIDNILA